MRQPIRQFVFVFVACSAAALANDGPSNVKIYRCEQHGAIEYADRPCGPESQALLTDTPWLSRYTPAAVPQRAPDTVVTGTSMRTTGRATRVPKLSAREQRRASCATLQTRLDRTESLLRAGYHGRRGERLRQDWRDLKDRYYSLRCLGIH